MVAYDRTPTKPSPQLTMPVMVDGIPDFDQSGLTFPAGGDTGDVVTLQTDGTLAWEAPVTACLPTGVQGSVLYHNGTQYVSLTPGVAGDVLESQGAGANPQWVAPGSVNGIRGETDIAGVGISTVVITFAVAMANTDYSISVVLRNTVDSPVDTYGLVITAKTVNGFTVELSAPTLSANYTLEWAVIE